MSIRTIYPRLEIRRRDALTNKMPTVLRSGDPHRLGNTKLVFDDNKIIVFDQSNNNQTINYPSLLHTGSRYTTADLTSSISVSNANIIKGITDNPTWLSLSDSLLIRPFTEEALHEQDIKSTSFYKTGSHYQELGTNDFSTNLGNKTQIRLSLPNNATTFLLSQTASLYYYNHIHSLFELVAENELDTPGRSVGYAFDSKLFGPFGNYTISGSVANRGEGKVPHRYFLMPATGTNEFIAAMQLNETGSALANRTFAANISQSLDIGKYITHPFLLEKMIVDIPITCGPGWGNDITKVAYGDPDDSTASKFINGEWDYGGPAITFSLLRQADNTHRELILSGTIIPNTDNMTAVANLRDDAYLEPNGYPGKYNSGFKSYGTPAAVVATTSGRATSSVRLQLTPAISNGFTSIHNLNGTRVSDTRLININPIGRGGSGELSGRSIFGREFSLPPITNEETTDQILAAAVGAPKSSFVHYVNNEISEYSPYLLMPGDKLIIAISKHRSVKYGPTNLINTNAVLNSKLDASHEVGIFAGKINITMYGSQIRDGKEYNNTLNQLFSTDSIYETIGEEPVLDQFDNSNAYAYSGSYIDVIMSGTLYSRHSDDETLNIYKTEKKVVANKTAGSNSGIFSTNLASETDIKRWELGGFQRFTQAFSENERYFDTLAPKISDVCSINGGAVIKYFFNAASVFALLVFDWKDSGVAGVPQMAGVADNIWTKTFPFEPRYSSLIRNLVPANSFLCTKLWTEGDVNITNISPQILRDCWVIHTYNTASTFAAGLLLDKDLTTEDFIASSNNEIIKRIYGFGRTSTSVYHTSGEFIGTTTAPSVRTAVSAGAHAHLYTRGWKYGLLNGFPQHSKTVFRRDKFGQLRDMLEQRLDGKIYDTVGITIDGNYGGLSGELNSPIQIKFIGQNNTVVRPENTYSSNLSTEATSSLPYCDGLVRNREEPIDLGNIGTTTITVV